MNRLHYLFPHTSRGVAGSADVGRRVISCPYGADIVRRIAYKPAVLLFGTGTGFTRMRHVADIGLPTCAVGCRLIEHVGYCPCGVGLEGNDSFWLIIQNHITLGVRDVGIGS